MNTNKIDYNKAEEVIPEQTSNEEVPTEETMPRKSRLSSKYQRRSKQTLVLSVLGIVAILFLLFRYGLPLISDASFLFGRVTSSPDKESNKTQDEDFIAIPQLDSLPKATKDETITVTGTSLSGESIKLYLNGNFDDEADVSDGSFELQVKLSEGANIIKAKAVKGEKESDFSNTVVISYVKEGPKLSIDSPGENAELKGANPIEVRGKTDPDVIVTVNDFQAVSSSDGSYSYLLTLKEGGNDIKVVAVDAAGNKTEKSIHVNYLR